MFLERVQHHWVAIVNVDRLKVLLQTETQTHRHYNHWVSIRKGIFKIYNDGGILSFFRGNGLNVLKIVPESALKFYVFEYSKQFIADHYNTDKESLGMIPRLFAGYFLLTTVVWVASYPNLLFIQLKL